MTIQDIQSQFCSKEIEQIVSTLQSNGEHKSLNLSGLIGSSYALLAANVAKETHRNQLFVLSNKERAAFFFNDLEKLLNDRHVELPNKRVHYLPSSYKRAHTAAELDNSNVKLRAEIVNKISKHPDREVKPRIADDTALVCGKVGRRQSFIRESRKSLPFFCLRLDG